MKTKNQMRKMIKLELENKKRLFQQAVEDEDHFYQNDLNVGIAALEWVLNEVMT